MLCCAVLCCVVLCCVVGAEAQARSTALSAYTLRATVIRIQNELVYDAVPTASASASTASRGGSAVSLRVHDSDASASASAAASANDSGAGAGAGAGVGVGQVHVVGAVSVRLNTVKDIALVLDRYTPITPHISMLHTVLCNVCMYVCVSAGFVLRAHNTHSLMCCSPPS